MEEKELEMLEVILDRLPTLQVPCMELK